MAETDPSKTGNPDGYPFPKQPHPQPAEAPKGDDGPLPDDSEME